MHSGFKRGLVSDYLDKLPSEFFRRATEPWRNPVEELSDALLMEFEGYVSRRLRKKYVKDWLRKQRRM
jgi:hypothetical protein